MHFSGVLEELALVGRSWLLGGYILEQFALARKSWLGPGSSRLKDV